MSKTDKPNVDIEDPAKRPSLKDLGAGPAERAVFGSQGGMGGFYRFIIPLAALLVCAGLFFALAGT
jgi:hypothetical protein